MPAPATGTDDRRPEPVELPTGAVARGTVAAPPSKSHAIRQLVCAALAVRVEPVRRCSVSTRPGPLPDDVAAAGRGLAGLGWSPTVERDRVSFGPEDDCAEEPVPPGVRPRVPVCGGVADVGGSGTALRFLAALAALGEGPTTVTGNEQLRRRPAGAIVPALRALGVRVEGTPGPDGVLHPPLVIAGGPPRGGRVVVDASESSQVVSALLLIGPALERGIEVVAADVASLPYVRLTVATMRAYGAEVEEGDGVWRVAPGEYDVRELSTEGDWSSAAFLLGAAAATGGDVRVLGLDRRSEQADRRVMDLLVAFGAGCVFETRDAAVRAVGRVSRPVDADLRDCPDLAPLVGALACLVPGTSRVRGAAHLRIKETDRIAEVVRCARAWGCDAQEHPDGFEVTGPARHGATIDPAGDHRLAMAFAVAGLAVPGTRIADPGCVAKSYPGFWRDVGHLTGWSGR